MILSRNDRGLEVVQHDTYPSPETYARTAPLIRQSSMVGPRGNGEDYLWIGSQHHLNADEVRELRHRLNNWLITGSLEILGDA